MSKKTTSLKSPDWLLDPREKKRLLNLQVFEQKVRMRGYEHIAGIDEAGRGPLAGPVVAAACMMPKELLIPGINDSKRLTPKQRKPIFERLTTHPEVFFGVGIISHVEIDRVNILQATLLAMCQAVEKLKMKPEYLLVDGVDLTFKSIPCNKIVRGDQSCYLIAAASIIAKESRDQLMMRYHEEWPQYGFSQNKGYPTKQHRAALLTHGPCPIHRMSFEPLKVYIQTKIV